jgi:uncharacterized protein (TIGR02145 family)
MKLSSFTAFLFLLLVFFGCEKQKGTELAQVVTAEVVSISASTATGGGEVVSDGGAEVTQRGVCYSIFPEPTIQNNNVTTTGGTGVFSLVVQGLAPNTKYYIRAFAVNEKGVAYGNQREFTTGSAANLPAVTTTNVSSITNNSASGGGNVTNSGGSAVTARGIVFSTVPSPNLNNNVVSSGSGAGTFNALMSGLTPGTRYYVRAFATNGSGTSYGNEVQFTTTGGGSTVPTLTTTSVTNITINSARSGGDITSDGGSPVTARGICYSTDQNPTIANTTVNAGTGTGSFVANMAGLSSGTTYYIRAFATNANGTAYGQQISFTTTGGGGNLATLTTSAATNITINSARSGGDITNDGGSPVTARGICYSTTQNPTIANTTVSAGSGTGSFVANMAGLNAGTTYYIRAFATNANGTAYGQQVLFTTTGGGGNLATLTTTVASQITSTSARSGGSISANGGSDITERGVVYATTQNPTTSNTKVNAGTTGIGTYIVNLTGLTSNTTYFVRAYAINSSGTAYGNEISFTTTGGSLATVTTSAATNVAITSASVGGNVTADGGATVTARGVCYGTSPNPTIANSVVNSGSGLGNFTSNLSGLSPATLYYARAFATNAGGTAYGNEISFTTNTSSGSGCQGLTMLTYNGFTYELVEIGSQCWFKENLRTKNYRNGTAIPLVTNNSQWGSDQSGAYTHYDNNASNEAMHGLLYNWHAVGNAAGLCPTGWKVPSDQDLCTLEALLGMTDPCMTENWRGSNQGTRMKDDVNWNGTNETGFSMLGSGNRNGNGTFGNINSNGYIWTSTQEGNDAWYRAFGGNRASIQRQKFAKSIGFSVRCVKE